MNNQNISPSIGTFREKVSILTPQQIPDELGGYYEIWTTSKIIWANIRMIQVQQQNNESRQENILYHEFLCRFVSVLPDQKIYFRNMTGIITNINELDNKKQFISFIAKVIIY